MPKFIKRILYLENLGGVGSTLTAHPVSTYLPTYLPTYLSDNIDCSDSSYNTDINDSSE